MHTLNSFSSIHFSEKPTTALLANHIGASAQSSTNKFKHQQQAIEMYATLPDINFESSRRQPKSLLLTEALSDIFSCDFLFYLRTMLICAGRIDYFIPVS